MDMESNTGQALPSGAARLLLDQLTKERHEQYFLHGDYAEIARLANEKDGTTSIDSSYVKKVLTIGAGKASIVTAATEFYTERAAAQERNADLAVGVPPTEP